jgi:hypothetical protein
MRCFTHLLQLKVALQIDIDRFLDPAKTMRLLQPRRLSARARLEYSAKKAELLQPGYWPLVRPSLYFKGFEIQAD